MTITLRPIAHSEIGLVRKTNQDSGFVSTSMLLVADGMGGAAAGDFASAVAVRELRSLGDDPETGLDALKSWKAAINKVNADVADMIAANPRLDGMGTTICGGVFDGETMHIAHIGDSRCYVYAEGNLHRLTHDHSYVQSLIDDGKLDESAAMTHPHRSLLLKVLNGQPEIKPDYLATQLAPGDRVMFCSDGLCGLVPDSAIAVAMGMQDLMGALATLVELAHAAGGTDNITVIMADVVELKTLTEPVETDHDDDGHTIIFTPDDALLTGQDVLPVIDFRTSGLIGAAADPKVVSRIKAATHAGVTNDQDTSEQDNEHHSSDKAAREKKRYAPGNKRRRIGTILVFLLVLAGLVAGGLVVRQYVINQYFVGNNDGTVAIYQGLPGDIAGIRTSWIYEQTTIKMSDLPISYRNRVDASITISQGGVEQARIAVQELERKSQECIYARNHRPSGAQVPSDGC